MTKLQRTDSFNAGYLIQVSCIFKPFGVDVCLNFCGLYIYNLALIDLKYI